MANKHVYELDIKTEGLISGYKNALKQMQQAGVSADVTKGLTDSLKKLETQYERLSAEGKRGFTNSKDIDNYKKRVDNLMRSFQMYEGSLSQVGVDISRVLERSRDSLEGLRRAFNSLNFKNVDKSLNNILGSQDKMKAASNELEKELQERVKKVNDLKDAWDQAATAAKNAAAPKFAKQYTKDDGKTGSIFTNTSTFTTKANALGSTQTLAEVKKDVEALFFSSMKGAADATQAVATFKNSLTDIMRASLSADGLAGIEKNMTNVFNQMQNATQAAQAAADAERDYKDAVASANEIGKLNSKTNTWTVDKTKVEEVTNATRTQIEVDKEHDQVLNQNIKTEADMQAALNGVNAAEQSVAGSANAAAVVFDKQSYSIYNTAKAAEEAERKFDQLKMRMLTLLSATSVFNLIKKQVKETYEDVKQLDKSFASIAMVTSNSVADMWQSYGHYAQMAAQLGQSTDSMIEASALFYQQGLKEDEALELTANTMKLATLAGNDFSTATQEMTSAIRGFKMEMSEGAHVTDVYSTLAANAAATVDDIAQAMARTASIANSAGMSFENTSAFLTQMIETTQESAENIGTSLKTIIARFTELKKNVAGTSESEFEDLDFNKVDTALKSVGVDLKDVNGQFRNLDEVFLELSEKWSTLDRNTQRYVATIAAGSRQQSRFIAMMDNYDRTAELMDKAANSTGKADEQFAKYADTMEYKLNQIKTKWEEFRVSILSSDTFKGLLDGFSSFLDRLKSVTHNPAKIIPAATLGIWAAKIFVTNAITTIKTMSNTATTAVTAIINKISNTAHGLLSKGLSKLHIEIDEDDFRAKIAWAQNEIQKLKSGLSAGEAGYSALFKISDNTGDLQFLQEYYNEIKAITGSAQEAQNAIRQLSDAVQFNGDQIQLSNTEASQAAQTLQNMKTSAEDANRTLVAGEKSGQRFEATAAATKMAWSGVASAVSMAAVSMLSGAATMDEAADMMLKSLAGLGVQMAIQAFSAGFSTGGSFGEGLSAGLSATGVGLIIVAIATALALVIKGIAALTDNWKKNHKSLDDQIAETQAKIEELEKRAKEKESAAKTAREEAKSVKELKEKYDELTNKVIKTTEEQEEYNDLVHQIQEDFPQIITYYNEVTGELRVQDELWGNIIEKADKLAQSANTDAYIANRELLETENQQNKNLAQQKYEEYNAVAQARDYFKDDIFKSIIEEVNNNTFDYDKETRGRVIYTNLTDFNDYNLDTLFKILNVDKENGEQMADLFDAMLAGDEDIYDLLDKTTESLITGHNEFVNDSKKSYEAQRRAMLANQLQNQEEISASLADFKARMTLTSEENNKDAVFNLMRAIIPNNKSYTDEDIRNGKFDTLQWGSDDNLITWSALASKNLGQTGLTAQDVIKRIELANGNKIASESDWDKIRKDDDDWAEYMEKFESTALAMIEEKNALLLSLNDRDAKMIENLYGQVYTMTEQDLENRRKLLESSLTSEAAKTEANNYIDEQIQALNDSKKKIADALGSGFSQAYFADWDKEALDELEKQIQSLSEKYGTGIATGFEGASLKLKDSLKLSDKEFEAITQVDWGNIDLTNVDKAKDSLIEALSQTMSSDKAEKVWEEFFALSKKFNIATFAVGSQGALDAIEDSIDTKLGDYIKSYSGISKIIKSQLEDGFISFSDSQELKKALNEIGLKMEDYVTFGENGAVLDSEALNQAFQDQSGLQAQIIEQARQETEEKIRQLKEQEAILVGLDSQNNEEFKVLEKEIAITNEKRAQLKILEAMNLVEVSNWDDMYTDSATIKNTKETSEGLQKIREQIAEYEDILKNQLTPGTEYYNYIQAKVNAAQKELNNIYKEQIPDLKSVKDAQEDYTKALKNYNDQLEQVAEKQEALNEKIKEYNDLLNGSDNRKSSLDVLYNYTEAIQTFNDEMSRNKDLLANSKTVDDSTQVLKKYTDAAHSLLVEEKAKQKVIEAGLKNYADMITNGTASYTNAETGAQTTINFGDYARFNSQTGKYMVDQRLLNESKFADKYKDLIEKNIEEYNKYADELLKSQDNVRKVEKEVEEERLNALKKYSAMEQEIAEGLKAQYQKEVDDLKSKYDAMKDADDDYLDALEDAINRQKDLRDRENQYEELAKKEKKLSLMQRDTSGANQLETAKLQEEIEESRENLLDEAIDDVIEELKRMYDLEAERNETELQLKEALLDNTAFWNQKAQGIAASFTSAEEYMEYMSNLSTEFADMTLAQQQEKLAEYGQTFEEATEYMAIVAMESTSSTQDFVLDVVDTTGEEIGNVIVETSETFTTEVTRMFDEVTAAFVEDMKKAEDAITDAKKALGEANEKLAEYAQELANAANAQATAQEWANKNQYSAPEENTFNTKSLYSAITDSGVDHNALDDIDKKFEGDDKIKAWITQAVGKAIYLTEDQIEEVQRLGFYVGRVGDDDPKKKSFKIFKKASDRNSWVQSQAASMYGNVKAYKTGGLVNQTGPAWVDGTFDEPEAFLSAEDTRNIGNAAKILSDIPWLERAGDQTTTITNNNGGNVTVEVNLNIDHISSDVDIDDVVNKVKDEIVDVARPIGSSVILQQQV